MRLTPIFYSPDDTGAPGVSEPETDPAADPAAGDDPGDVEEGGEDKGGDDPGLDEAAAAGVDDGAGADDDAPDDNNAFLSLRRRIDSAFSDKGEIDGDAAQQALDSLDEKRLKKLPAEAQVVLRAVPKLVEAQVAKERATLKAKEDALASSQAELRAEAKELRRQQAEYAALLDTPEIQEIMQRAAAAKAAGKKPDLLTPEGQQEYLDQQVAVGLQNVFGKAQAAAQRTRVEVAWKDFKADEPFLQDPANVARMNARVTQMRKAREEAGQPPYVSPDEWPRIVRELIGEDAIAERQRKTEAARKARAAAARKVARPRTAGDPAGDPIIDPKLRGADRYAAIQRLKDTNPAAYARFQAS